LDDRTNLADELAMKAKVIEDADVVT